MTGNGLIKERKKLPGDPVVLLAKFGDPYKGGGWGGGVNDSTKRSRSQNFSKIPSTVGLH